MAKRKYEFRPDKPQVSFLNKLYLTRQQRMTLLRWLLYCVLLVVLSVLQDVVLCQMNIFTCTTDLVPCAIILICVQLGAERCSIFALIAALLYKFTGTAPGYHVIALIPLLGITAAALRQSFFRRSFSSIMLCSCSAVLIYEMGIFAEGLLFQHTIPERGLSFLVTAGLSVLSYPILYPLIKAIDKIGDILWKE